jgi:acetyl-CoA synthetase
MEPFSDDQMTDLNTQLGTYVTVSNPFDYNTSIWGDGEAPARCFTSALSGSHDAAFLVYDHPSVTAEEVKTEISEWIVAIEAFIAAHKKTGMPAFVISTISELLPVSIREHLIANGIVPLQGFQEGLIAYAAAVGYHAFRKENTGRDLLPRSYAGFTEPSGQPEILDEWDSKNRLGAYGLTLPPAELVTADEAPEAANRIGYPVVIKAVGKAFSHKSDLGAVKLNLESPEDTARAVKEISESAAQKQLAATRFLVESMVQDVVAELIVGIKCDEQFGPTLVIGAGGTLVELISESVSLLLPVDRIAVNNAIRSLTVTKLLDGFRGNPQGDVDACVDAILNIAAFAEDHWDTLLELDVNPLMVLPKGKGIVVADALVSMASG